MENNIYLNKLIEQFRDASGVTIDVNSKEFMKEFREWLFRMQVLGDEYGRQLDKNNIYFASDKYAEVGKGPKDSIALMYDDMDTTIISPYMEGYKKDNTHRKIINSSFTVTGPLPTLIKEENGKLVDIKLIKPEDIRVFMTHNPYNLGNVTDWKELHNNPENGIIIGMFGYTYDKDYEAKIKYMEGLKNCASLPYFYDSFTVNDRYFSVFSTNMHEKNKIYTKKR